VNGSPWNHLSSEQTDKIPRQAIMKEATRLHPGVGFPLERSVPPEGATLCGFPLAAGTNVSMMAPVVQIDPEVFGEDSQSFRPERWLESDPEQLKLMERSMLVVSSEDVANTRDCWKGN
jgi:cytochrome P450